MATSIGRLVVSLTTLTGPFIKGMAGAAGSVKSFAGSSLSFIGSLTKSLFSLPGLILGAFGGVAIGSLFSSALAAFDEDEKAASKLGAVLNATGHAAGFTREQLQETASALQKVTTFGDETIVNGQALLATFRNIKSDNFTEATKAMLDMSTVMDQDVKSSAVQIGKALNDPVKGLTALQKIGVTFTDQQKSQIKAMAAAGDVAGAQRIILAELRAEFGGAAEAIGQTGGGQRSQLKNAFGDIMEGAGAVLNMLMGQFVPRLTATFGSIATWMQANAGMIAGKIMGFVTPIAAFVVTAFKATVSFLGPIVTQIWGFLQSAGMAVFEFLLPIQIAYLGFLKSLWSAVVSIVGGLIEAVGALLPAGHTVGSGLAAVFAWLKETIVLSLITVEFSLKNWQRLVEWAFLTSAAKVTTFVNQVQYFLTTVIPAVLVWFGRNWKEIFVDVFNFTATVFTNLASNIVSIIKNIPGLISGSVSFGDLWTPLSDGFVSTLRELPEIAPREIGQLEQILTANADKLKADLDGDFNAFVGQRLGEIEGTSNAFKSGLADLFKFDGAPLEGPKMPDLKIAPEAEEAIDSVGQGSKLGAAEVGRFSLSGLLANDGTAPMEKLHKATKQGFDESKSALVDIAAILRDRLEPPAVVSI